MRKHWTLEEDQILKDLTNQYFPLKEIAISLNRSYGSVKGRLLHLGIKSIYRKLIIQLKCLNCNKEFTVKHKNRKFCSKSCSASMNNKLKPKRQAIVKNCLNCSKEILLRRKYCSDNCQIVFPIQNSILLGTASARTIKRYLILKDRKCAICNNTKWNNLEITLELDHIDGNSENNNLTNLRLVCPNCHSQTNTYKGKNRGNGRYKRMERYRNNKSW